MQFVIADYKKHPLRLVQPDLEASKQKQFFTSTSSVHQTTYKKYLSLISTSISFSQP